MPLKRLIKENIVICMICKTAYMAEDWNPTDILKTPCPKCKSNGLYWAIKEKTTED